MNKLLERASLDPRICGCKPCIKATRTSLSLILELLSEGMTQAELLVEYPQLAPEDIRAAIAYGAEMARERVMQITLHQIA